MWGLARQADGGTFPSTPTKAFFAVDLRPDYIITCLKYVSGMRCVSTKMLAHVLEV